MTLTPPTQTPQPAMLLNLHFLIVQLGPSLPLKFWAKAKRETLKLLYTPHTATRVGWYPIIFWGWFPPPFPE